MRSEATQLTIKPKGDASPAGRRLSKQRHEMTTQLKGYVVRSITECKGSPRIYLDISAMADAGFEPGKTYVRDVDDKNPRITLVVQKNGTHVVSRKEKGNKVQPIIDVNNIELLKPFAGMKAVRIVVQPNKIHILPLASETKRLKRLQSLRENLEQGEITTGGISFGGGVLDHAGHAGLADAGIRARLVMANEIDADLLTHACEHNEIWNKDTVGLAAPMQELAQDDWAMARLPRQNLLTLGIPCSGSSQAGKSKRKLAMMECHPHVGGLIAPAIMIINQTQPAVLVVENVTQYELVASAQILRSWLRDSGYKVQEVTLASNEWGSLENRVRWFLVAASAGIDINLEGLAPALKPLRKLGEILDPIGPEDQDWRTFEYLKIKEIRDSIRGNCFAMQVVTPESTSVPTIRAGYAKGGSADPLLAHPTNPDLLRQLTVDEHARAKDVPLHLVTGLNKTDGHKLLGQGVAYRPVRALFERIGQCLMKWKEAGTNESIQDIGYSLSQATA
jgi:DNA (cytosine-5)-methyltransferase 1